MRKKKPGALRATEPKVIWVKTFIRPAAGASLVSAINKSNNIIEEILATRSQHYIIDINNQMEKQSNFNNGNYLNSRGKAALWIEINKSIEAYNYGKDELTPLANKPQQMSYDENKQECRIHKMGRRTNEAAATTQYKPSMQFQPTFMRKHHGHGDTY